MLHQSDQQHTGCSLVPIIGKTVNGTGSQLSHVLQLSSDFRNINVKSSSELQIVLFLWELTLDVIPSLYSDNNRIDFAWCSSSFVVQNDTKRDL